MKKKRCIFGIIFDKFDKLFANAICIGYVAIIGVVLTQVFARIYLPQAPKWTEELSRYLQVYLVAFSVGHAIKDDAFVSVDTIFKYLKSKATKYVKLIDQFVVLILFLFCLRYSFDMYKLGILHVAISMPKIKMNYVYFSMILASGCIVVSVIRKIVNMIGNKRGEEK